MDINNSNPNPVVVNALAKRAHPSLSEKEIENGAKLLASVGIDTEEEVERTLAIAFSYRTRVGNIVAWLNQGMTLKQVEQTLAVRAELGEYYDNLSIKALRSLLDKLSPGHFTTSAGAYVQDASGKTHFVVSPDVTKECIEILDTLIEASCSDRYQLQHMEHRIDEYFGGNIHAAYRMANDDPHLFQRVIQGKLAVSDAKILSSNQGYFFDEYTDLENQQFQRLANQAVRS